MCREDFVDHLLLAKWQLCQVEHAEQEIYSIRHQMPKT